MRAPLLLAALAISTPASAQSGAGTIPSPGTSAQGEVAVTIYNNNQALVQDRRELSLPNGRHRQEFPDVSAQIRPQTVTLSGDDIAIVEQNFDFDLLSPQALMEKAVGETITLVRTNPATGAEMRERARVLAANGGVVLQIGDRIEVLRDDGLPVRVIFDRVPENLRARPTLSVTVQSQRAARRPLTLTYLTQGLGWSADYVALFDESSGRMDVQGWVTLTNNSGTEYRNADTLLVAGGIGEGGPSYPGRTTGTGTVRRAGTETAGRERLGDYYLYPLAERTTIANAQTKQVSFLSVAGTPTVRAYEFRNAWMGSNDQPVSVNSVLRFSCSRSGGLGDALPAGTVRVYQRDARGNPQFVGESRIGHTPMGSDIALTIGQAFDVRVQSVVVRREALSPYRWRTSMRYTLTNARPEATEVSLVQSGLWGDVRIIEQSQPSERTSADETRWRVQVPANGETQVTATFETRY